MPEFDRMSFSATAPATRSRYVLVTPARNEEKTIGETLASVCRQKHLPVEWVVVSDGSTDRTDERVREYARRYPFIRLLRLEPNNDRDFASVVFATNAGVAALQTPDYDFIGLLDADLRFGPSYFSDLIARFRANPRLGLGGGLALDVINGRYYRHRHYPKNVAGAVHFFRRACFEAIQPLVALPEGGWDAITNVQARAHGFDTQTFEDLIVDHLKPRNSMNGGWLRRKWQMGVRDYALGYDPVFALMKCFSRAREKPAVIGSLAMAGGFMYSLVTRRARQIPAELAKRFRTEQRERMWGRSGQLEAGG
jgi:poly-beta-1,6-N-acetyl-D-glucosamine synthase